VELKSLLEVLEQLAPVRHAEPWDNVGLLVGDPCQIARKVLLTIDYTPPVAEEALSHACDVIIAYHPPIFKGLKRLTPPDVVFDAARRGIAIYSPHTAWDVAVGGTNDLLADVLELQDRRPLKPADPAAPDYKLVTFVPNSHVNTVSEALFSAGAGQIGDYARCSFRSEGTGTFQGDATTHPTVGARETFTLAPETRLETLVPARCLAAVLNALHGSHPYEEVAYDLFPRIAPPSELGLGRIGTLPDKPVSALLEQIKRGLEVDHLMVAGDTDQPRRLAAVCAGACGELMDHAIRLGVDFYLTGEMRHHDVLRGVQAGLTVVCTRHSNSERASLKRLAARLKEHLPELEVCVSLVDADPLQIM